MSSSPNPYAPPQMPGPMISGPPPGSEQFAPCYKCGCPFAKRVTFTWWGGLLGPKLFTHVTCVRCGTAYNGKTGRSNNTAIAIYVGIGTVVGLILAVMLLLLQTM